MPDGSVILLGCSVEHKDAPEKKVQSFSIQFTIKQDLKRAIVGISGQVARPYNGDPNVTHYSWILQYDFKGNRLIRFVFGTDWALTVAAKRSANILKILEKS